MISKYAIQRIVTFACLICCFCCMVAAQDDDKNNALSIISSPEEFPADKSDNVDRARLGIGEKSTLSLSGKKGETPKDKDGNPKEVTWMIISGHEYGTLKKDGGQGEEFQTATLTISTDLTEEGTITAQAEVEGEEPAKKDFKIVLPKSLKGIGARMEANPSLDPVEGFQGPSPSIFAKCDRCKQCPRCGTSLTTRCAICIEKKCKDCKTIKLEGNTGYYGANANIEVEMGPTNVNFRNVPYRENDEESPESFPHKPSPDASYPNAENRLTDSIGYYAENKGSGRLPANITWVCGWYTTKGGNLNHPIDKRVLQKFSFQRVDGGIKVTISKFGCSVSRNCTSSDNQHEYN